MATQEDKFVARLRGALGSVLEKEADMFDYVKSLAPEQLQGAVGMALQPAVKPRRDLAKALTSQTPLARNARAVMAPVTATASAVGQMAEQAVQQNFSIPQGIADRANALVEGMTQGATESAKALAGPGPNIAAAAGQALGQAMPQAPQLAQKAAPVQGAQAAQAVAPAPSPLAPAAAAPTAAPAPVQPDETDVQFFEYAHDPNRKWGGYNPQSTVDQQKMAVIKQLRAQDPKATPQQIALRAYKIQYGSK